MPQQVNQDDFTSMKGHVADGTEVIMRNGDVLVVKAVMKGWQLYHIDQPHGPPTNSAYVVECLVFAYPIVEAT